MYDSQVGRWFVIDPMAEKHYTYTAYAYVYNNPIMFIDPFGLDSTKITTGFSKRMDQNFKSIKAVINDPKSIKQFINGLIDDPLGTIDNLLGSAAEALDNTGKKLSSGSNEDFGEVLADGFTFWLTGKAFGGTTKNPSNLVEQSGSLVTQSETQGFKSFSAFKRANGPAGEGQAWHHIVEQTPNNLINFGAEALHNNGNLLRLPNGAGSVHAKISGYYSSIQPFTNGQTVRQWLSPQNFQQQYQFGMLTLKKFGQ